MLTGKHKAKSHVINVMLNFGLLIGPFILAVLYPNVGKIAAILGATGSFFCVITLPVIVYVAQKKTEIKNPFLMAALRRNDFSSKLSPPKPKKRRISIIDSSNFEKDIRNSKVKRPDDYGKKRRMSPNQSFERRLRSP